jgi:PAS domain S-box-containing protein
MAISSKSTIRVLHVDDEPSFLDLTETFLQRELDDCIIKAASGPDEATELLTDGIDCIVSDYDMPGTNGIKFLETVRTEYPDLPFILFTGKGSEEVAGRAISAGVTDYLQKQSGTDQYGLLANRIRNAVSQYRAERQTRRALNAIQSAEDGISLLDEDGQFIYLNDSYATLFGYDREELIGLHWEHLYPDEAVSHVYETMLPEAREGSWEGMTTMLRKDGTQKTVEHTLTYSDNETLICTVSEPDDNYLRETLALREQAMDEAPIGIILTDLSQPDNPIFYANDTFVGLTGYPRKEIIGHNCRFLQGPETRDEPVAAMREAVDAGEPTAVTLRNYRKDGTEFWSRICIAPVRDETGTITNYAGFQYDVTERMEYEQQLSEQSELLDDIASTLSHDLQNAVDTTGDRLALARQECDSEHLSAMAETHEHIEQLLDRVVAVAKQEEIAIDPQPVRLSEPVETCRQLIETGEARVSVDSGVTIRADKSRFVQLVEKLLRNVLDHGGDNITVSVGTLPDADGFYIADDGVGVPTAERDLIFESGYTSSETGMGVGLSVVKRIVDAHGWEMAVSDSAAGGARFEFTSVDIVR